MGAYLLQNCDTKKAMDTWRLWLQEPSQQRHMPMTINVEVTPALSKTQNDVLFSAQFSFPKSLRIFYGIALCFFFVIFEGTFLMMPWIGNFLLQKSSPFLASVVGSLLAFLICLSGLGPSIALGLAGAQLKKKEYSLVTFIKKKAIEAIAVAPPRSWILFPGDLFIIQGSIIGVLCLQLSSWLGLSSFLPLLIPYLGIGAVLTCVVLLREYAYKKIAVTQQQHAFWKLEVTRLAGRATYFFLFPLLFYAMIFLLKTVSFALPLRQKTSSTVTSNLVITTVGYPNLQAWEKSTHLLVNQFFQQILSLSSIAITLVLLISFFSLWGSLKPYSLAEWNTLEIKRLDELPDTIAQQPTPSFLASIVIIFDWFLIVAIHGIGTVVVMIATCWPYITDGKLIAAVGDWTVPFLWYQESLKLLWGDIAGAIIGSITVFLLCAPAWLWLAMWLCSLGEAFWRFLIITCSPTPKPKWVTTLVADLCDELQIARPIIRIDTNSKGVINTTPLLPFARFCVISIPKYIIELELERDEMRGVLAHELAHVVKHAWKIWVVQQLSRIAIFGSGYLTLQLDYWHMELEADAIAVDITRDPTSLQSALKKIQAEMGKPQSQKGEKADGVAALYDWFFENNLWGAFHPGINDRIAHLQTLSSTTNKTFGIRSVYQLRSASRTAWQIATGIVIGVCIVSLLHNVIFPSPLLPKPAPSTVLGCPAAHTVRQASLFPFAQGTNQSIVYTQNEGTRETPIMSTLKRYDLQTHLTTTIIQLPHTWITSAQISANRQWILLNAQIIGKSELQLIRVDGQQIQTIYCLDTNASFTFSWSPDPQWIVLWSPVLFGTTIDIINIAEGTTRVQELSHTETFTPLAWNDNTHLFLHESSLALHHSIDKLSILTLSQQAATITPIPGINIQGEWAITDFHMSQDHHTLFTNTYTFGQGISTGPGIIKKQSVTGGNPQTLYTTPHYAITDLQVAPTFFLFTIGNSDLDPHSARDFSQNGLWKMNSDGSGVTRLTSVGKGDTMALADVSPDGTMYGLITFASTKHTMSLEFNTLQGNTPTVFVSIADNIALNFIGWAVV